MNFSTFLFDMHTNTVKNLHTYKTHYLIEMENKCCRNDCTTIKIKIKLKIKPHTHTHIFSHINQIVIKIKNPSKIYRCINTKKHFDLKRIWRLMKNKLNRNRSTINWWWTYRMRCPYGWNIVLGEDCLHSRIYHGHLSRNWKHWNQIKNVKSSNAYRQIQSGVLHINITVHFFYFMHTYTHIFISLLIYTIWMT